MSKHPKSRARNGNAKWGPPVNSPGGTTIQISSANGASVKRLKTTTPGGKNNVFHQCCVDSVSCSLLNPCSSCTIKNQQADRNARAKTGRVSAKQTNKDQTCDHVGEDQSCDHVGEPDGTLETHTSEALNRSRREQYKQRSVDLNKIRRAKHKIIFSKIEYDALVLLKDELMLHYNLMSSDEDPNIRSTYRKLHEECFEKITSRYEDLGDANCPYAMYEYANFLFGLDKWGMAPDFEVALCWLKKAAALDHAASLEWLSSIHGCESEASEFGVPVDMRLSVQYMEASADASRWDGNGRKGSALSIRPHLSQFLLYKAFSTGYLHDVAGAVQENQEKALSYLTMAAEGGHGEAKFRLYEKFSSRGDLKQARVWLERAATPEWINGNTSEADSDYKEFEMEAMKLLSHE